MTNFDENTHDCPSSEGELESVLILDFICTVGQKNDFLRFLLNKIASNFIFFLTIWMKIYIKAFLQMKTQNPYHFLISFCTVGCKFDFFRFFIKMLITFSFFFPIWIKKHMKAHLQMKKQN